jgi:hypothetical protein
MYHLFFLHSRIVEVPYGEEVAGVEVVLSNSFSIPSILEPGFFQAHVGQFQ